MTEPQDDLIARLTAADPIDEANLPSANDPAPRQLLEYIMNASPSSDAPSPESAVVELPEVRDIDRYRRAPRSRRLGFLAVAAAVVLLVAGFALFAPESAEPALATVHSAAEATADFDSGRATTDFNLEATDGTSSGTMAGVVAAEFAGDNMAITVDITEASGEASGFVAPANEARLVDNVLYSTDGVDWYSIEAGGLIARTVTDIVDPRSVLAEVEQLLDTTEVGPAVVDGIDTTQFRSVVDLEDQSITDPGWLPLEATDLEAVGEITVDLYIDDAGVLRRLDVSGDVDEPDSGTGAITMSVTTVFTDLGADISIEAPADATPIELGGELPLADLND